MVYPAYIDAVKLSLWKKIAFKAIKVSYKLIITITFTSNTWRIKKKKKKIYHIFDANNNVSNGVHLTIC